MKKTTLPTLPFKRFLTYDEVTAFVTRLAAARPGLVQRGRLGFSREGRDLHLLTITDPATGPAADKPAYLVHGNIHAAELSGTHAALYTARRLAVDHARTGLLRRVAFYIVPRLNPDGAEFVATTSGAVRSRTDRSPKEPNTLYQQDVNADGLILTMRQPHPDGAFATDPGDARLLVRRTKESKPPFFRTFPEGTIHDWDGGDTIRIEGRSFDWNRNWSHDWRPEPEQPGAGDFPFSEPEMRCLAEFIHARPNLFGMLGYHNGPAAVLRPPSNGSDDGLDEDDVRVLRELAAAGSRHTGLPVYSVSRYHNSNRRSPGLRGHFHDFGYHHLGLFVFEFELGLLYQSAGISTEELFAVKDAAESSAIQRRLLQWWDRQENRDPVYHPWTPFEHPQLGRVEIGGLLLRHMSGPTLADLKRIVRGTYRFTLEHAARHPWVKLEDLSIDRMAESIVRVRARVANRGSFPTHVSNKGRELRRLPGVRVELHLEDGVTLLSRQGHVCAGHLEGLTGSLGLEWFLDAAPDVRRFGTIRVAGGTGGNVCADLAVT